MSRVNKNMPSVAYADKQISPISEVLSKLMKIYGGLSGSELAERIGLPSQTVNRLLSGFVQDPRTSTLVPVADYFGITVDQLIGKQSLPQQMLGNTYEGLQPSMILPLFSFNEPIDLRKNDSEFKEWFQWSKSADSEGENNFAVRVEGRDLEPTFSAGTTLVIDPILEIQDEDFVLVTFQDDKVTTVKKVLLNQPEHYFLPIRDGLKIIPFKDIPHKIIGVVIEAHVDLRKKK